MDNCISRLNKNKTKQKGRLNFNLKTGDGQCVCVWGGGDEIYTAASASFMKLLFICLFVFCFILFFQITKWLGWNNKYIYLLKGEKATLENNNYDTAII